MADVKPELVDEFSFSPFRDKLAFDATITGDTPVEKYIRKLEAAGVLNEELIRVESKAELIGKIKSLQSNQRLLMSVVFDFPGYGRYTHWWALAGLIRIKFKDKLPELFSEFPIKDIFSQSGSKLNGRDTYAILIGDGSPLGIIETPFFAIPWDLLQNRCINVLSEKPIVDSDTLAAVLKSDANRNDDNFSQNCAIVTVNPK